MAPVDNLIPWQALKPIQNDDERQRGSRAAARAGGVDSIKGRAYCVRLRWSPAPGLPWRLLGQWHLSI